MKSNLGQYQMITSISKKVGGPYMLIGMIFIGGFVTSDLYRCIYKRLNRSVKQINDKNIKCIGYSFDSNHKRCNSVYFKKENFNIESDEDDSIAGFVEIIVNQKDRYFIDKDSLANISNYNV